MAGKIPIPIGYQCSSDPEEASEQAQDSFLRWLSRLRNDRAQAVLPFIRITHRPSRILFGDGSNPPFNVYTDAQDRLTGILAMNRNSRARASYGNTLGSWFDEWPWDVTGMRNRIIFLHSKIPHLEVYIAVPNTLHHLNAHDTILRKPLRGNPEHDDHLPNY